MSRRSPSQVSTQTSDLHEDAELAARGDEQALDRLFAVLAGQAWGIAFAAADAVSPATEAVAEGFTETLQVFDSGIPVDDVRDEVLQATRLAALDLVRRDDATAVADREPVSLLGETKDRQATLAFTALPEMMRSMLWLVEVNHLTVTRSARLLGQQLKAAEDILRQARTQFRRYYVDAMRKEYTNDGCSRSLDKAAAYAGRTLNAGDTIEFEKHLAQCDDCRSLIAKLDDLEGRLRAAIPPLPAWTRQLVTDRWSEITPVSSVVSSREPTTTWWITSNNRKPALLALAAVLVAVAGIALAVDGGSSDNNLAAQSKLTDLSSVATPTSAASEETLPPETTAAPTTETLPETTVPPPPPTTTQPAPAPTAAPATTAAPARRPVVSQVPRTTTPPPPPTTTTPPVPPTSVTSPYELIDLPPTSG